MAVLLLPSLLMASATTAPFKYCRDRPDFQGRAEPEPEPAVPATLRSRRPTQFSIFPSFAFQPSRRQNIRCQRNAEQHLITKPLMRCPKSTPGEIPATPTHDRHRLHPAVPSPLTERYAQLVPPRLPSWQSMSCPTALRLGDFQDRLFCCTSKALLSPLMDT